MRIAVALQFNKYIFIIFVCRCSEIKEKKVIAGDTVKHFVVWQGTIQQLTTNIFPEKCQIKFKVNCVVI